jgi:hypothetical protein
LTPGARRARLSQQLRPPRAHPPPARRGNRAMSSVHPFDEALALEPVAVGR